MARAKASSSYRHDTAERLNQPTAETAAMAQDGTDRPEPFTAANRRAPGSADAATSDRRDEPEPLLRWERAGETSTGDEDHGFAGGPLYTREKIEPLALIEQLRKPHASPQPELFDGFNGLPDDNRRFEFYRHSGHWQNRLIHGDSARVAQSLIAKDGLAGRVQMIYFDPPYGIDFKSNFTPSTGSVDTPGGAASVPFGDTAPVKAFRDTYERGIHSYLDAIHERLVLFRELLTDSGSLFLQIGDDNVHRLAVLCDEVFGADNRVATITWRPTAGSSSKTLPESASYLLWYAQNKGNVKYWQLFESLTRRELLEQWGGYLNPRVQLPDGTTRESTAQERREPDEYMPENARFYRWMALTSQGASTTGRTCPYEYEGVVYHCGESRHWRVSTPAEQTRTIDQRNRVTGAREVCGLDRLAELGRLEGTGEGGALHWKWYEDEVPGRRIDNVWHRQSAPSGKRYPVQTADRIIERCILMSTDPGDLVLDPTCGSGVAAHMAERWGRRWIGIDVSRVAIAVARRQMLTAVHPWHEIRGGGSDPAAGLMVDTMQKVSAATLAYDTVDDPENTIYLVDRPKRDKSRLRLSGPFTVESSSPYTHLPFTESPLSGAMSRGGSGDDTIRFLEALRNSPIRDARGREVLSVVEAEPWPDGGLVGWEADCRAPGREEALTAAVMIAASDETVTGARIAAAAAEARRTVPTIRDLIVVGCAFEDAAAGEKVGPVAVHKVQASRDLAIPELSGSDGGALTLLGEPDIDIAADDNGRLTVELLGFDTYDPSTGTVAPSSCDDVDCWMIDTDHDRLSFFPRLVYLPGHKRDDPAIKRLLKQLGRELDPAAAEALCGLKSQPFDPPTAGNCVAVKIVTRTGAEMSTAAECGGAVRGP